MIILKSITSQSIGELIHTAKLDCFIPTGYFLPDGSCSIHSSSSGSETHPGERVGISIDLNSLSCFHLQGPSNVGWE